MCNFKRTRFPTTTEREGERGREREGGGGRRRAGPKGTPAVLRRRCEWGFERRRRGWGVSSLTAAAMQPGSKRCHHHGAGAPQPRGIATGMNTEYRIQNTEYRMGAHNWHVPSPRRTEQKRTMRPAARLSRVAVKWSRQGGLSSPRTAVSFPFATHRASRTTPNEPLSRSAPK